MSKRYLSVIKAGLVIIGLCACLVGCGNDSAKIAEETNNSIDNAKAAYALLTSSADMVETIGAGISGAWGYAIDNSSDYSGTYSGLARVCGLSTEEVTTAFNQYTKDVLGGKSFSSGVLLSDFQDVLKVLINYGYAPYYEQLDNDLATAKSLIKSVDQSESYYSDLVDYYTAVSNYLEFCKSPTGNYQSVGTTRNEYETTISTAKSKLSFYLE